MRALPLYIEERLNGARAAVLAPKESSAHAMAKMYELMGTKARYDVKVFSERDEAMRWLVGEDVPA
jgi:hypothetical protein